MDKDDTLKKKVTYDPGWNDPPLYSYESTNAAGQPNPNKKVNVLNKRVAYPLGQQAAVSGGMNPTLPPSTNAVPLPPSCPLIPGLPGVAAAKPPQVVTASDEAPVDKVQTLTRVKEIFKEVLEEKAGELEQSSEEINRRLLTMYKMWEDDKLNSNVHRRLLELAEALKSGDLDRADHLHVGLAVDHPSVCASWIPGVRRLVQHLKSAKQPNAQPDQGVSEPLQTLVAPEDTELVPESH